MPICSPPNFSCAWPAVNFNRNLSEFNDCVLRTGNSQAKIREQGFAGKGLEGRDYCASELCASKPGKVLRIARYARIANSFVLSVSHLHSHSSRNTDCVCSAGIPVVSISYCHSQSILSAQLIREFLQAACSTSERTTLHTEDYPAKPAAGCVERRGRAGSR